MTKHENIPGALDLSRRSFLVSAGAAGLVCGFGALPGLRRRSAAAPYDPSIWYGIDPDGLVTVNVGKADMGQHVASTMAQIVAEELGAAWSHMRVNLVGNDPKYNDPVLGAIITGGSWSTMMNFDAMSRAGAAGRMALVEAGGRHARRSGRRVRSIRFPHFRSEVGQVGQLRRHRQVGQGGESLHRGRTEGDHAEVARSIYDDRQGSAAARHSVQGERHGQIRHRHVPAGHGLWPDRDAPGALRRQGDRGRRQRGQENPRLHPGGGA